MLVPIPYVRRLELPRRQQIIVASLFAGGIFVTAAGAARTAITFITFSDPNRDLTWNSIPVIIASALELYIGIVSPFRTRCSVLSRFLLHLLITTTSST